MKRSACWCVITLLLAVPAALAWPAAAQASEPIAVPVDLSLPPVPIRRELLGQFIPNPSVSAFVRGSSDDATAGVATHLRGLYGAFYAEFYDWRDPLGLNDPLRPDTGQPEIDDQLGTLDYLRLAAANSASVSLNVNTRGVRDVFTQPLLPDLRWVMTDTAVLAGWAADWLLYTNYTVQVFDTSAPPEAGSPDFLEARSAAVLAEIAWRNRDGSGERPVLPEPGEQLPKVVYWEIGNEPNYPLSGFRLLPDEFAARYLEISEAMIAMDLLIHGERTIKLGPSLTATYPPARNAIADYLAALERVGAVVDYVGYHPYTTLFGDWDVLGQNEIVPSTPARAEDFTDGDVEQLRTSLSGLYGFHETLAISTTLAAPAGVELWANEWNPSSWEAAYVDRWKARSLAHSLGVLETLFAFARLELGGAVYFADVAFPRADRRQPLYETFRFLEWAWGDELLAVYDGSDPGQTQVRAYVTRHAGEGAALPGAIVLWTLNWGEGPAAFRFELRGLPGGVVLGQRCGLAAPSLLHGAFNDPAGLPLEGPLRVACDALAEGVEVAWVGGRGLDVTVEAPANGWTAVVLWPEGRAGRE